jgi:hypothetical protein
MVAAKVCRSVLAGRMVGYATRPDGSLHEITRVKIPYNSPQGLAGS